MQRYKDHLSCTTQTHNFSYHSRSLLVDIVGRLREPEDGFVEEEDDDESDHDDDNDERLASCQVSSDAIGKTPVKGF